MATPSPHLEAVRVSLLRNPGSSLYGKHVGLLWRKAVGDTVVLVSVSGTGCTPPRGAPGQAPRFPAAIPTTSPFPVWLPHLFFLLCLDPSCKVHVPCAPGARDRVAVFTPRTSTQASPARTPQLRSLLPSRLILPPAPRFLPLRAPEAWVPQHPICPLSLSPLMASMEWEACPARSSPPRGAQRHQIQGGPRHPLALCPRTRAGHQAAGPGPPLVLARV